MITFSLQLKTGLFALCKRKGYFCSHHRVIINTGNLKLLGIYRIVGINKLSNIQFIDYLQDS